MKLAQANKGGYNEASTGKLTPKYWTKHHAAAQNKNMRPIFLTMPLKQMQYNTEQGGDG